MRHHTHCSVQSVSDQGIEVGVTFRDDLKLDEVKPPLFNI
jgi:hypothetical protein